jgi:HSP20 family protein
VARDDIERLHDELEDVFSALWHGPRFATHRRGFRPRIDVFRTAEPNELRVVVDLAGVDPADVRIAIHELALVIAGHRRRPVTDSRPSYHLMEIEYGPFERRIAMPEPVDPKKASATYERGLLTIVLPVTTAPPRRARISIEVRTIA